jgi:nicotinamidase-related amidase
MKLFKPETSALVLIDHQVGTLQFIRNISSDGALRNAVVLAKAAKAFGMPVVLTSSQEDHPRENTPHYHRKSGSDSLEF